MVTLRVKKVDDTDINKVLIFKCPHCEEEITYANFVPIRCPACDRGVPDLKRIAESPECRVDWHRTGLMV